MEKPSILLDSPSSKINCTISYSNNILIEKEGKGPVFLPFGEINKSSFRDLRKKLKSQTNLTEKYIFPPIKKILPKKTHLELVGFPPRDYQKEAISKLFHKGRQTGILKAPTGAGKGSVIGYMIAEKNLSTLIIVPTADLVFQTAERIRSLVDIPWNLVGEIGEKVFNPTAPVIVSTWQSMAVPKTLESMKSRGFGMLICDEVHKASAPVLNRVIDSLSIPLKYGMSATPYRTREEQMEKVYDVLGDIVYTIDIEDLYSRGFLLRPTIKFKKTESSVDIEHGIRSYFLDKMQHNEKMRYVFAGKLFRDPNYSILSPDDRLIDDIVKDPKEGEWELLSDIARNEYIKKLKSENEDDEVFKKKLGLAKGGIEINEKRMNLVVKEASSLCSKKSEKAIVLFHTKKAGVSFSDKMREKGFSNIMIINGDSPTKREDIKRLSKGLIDNYIVVSTVSLLSEGNDIPSLSKIFLGAPAYPPFTDIGRLEQIIGRAVRPDPNNSSKSPYIVIFDDSCDGWMKKKKDMAYENLSREFIPKIDDGIIDKQNFFIDSVLSEEGLLYLADDPSRLL